ncbi:MAG: hypothetical protein IPM92_16580 [Saprospiraceae bacterium]|nr:hypothetical protein [Saprospiraceae bacterium]
MDLILETTQFKAYRGNDLPYFVISCSKMRMQVNFNGSDLESIVANRKQIGRTNWYMINFNSNQVGNPQTISISSSIKIICTIIQIGGGFSNVGYFFSNLIDQPALPNVLYLKQGDCPTGSALLTAGSNGAQYQWYLDGKLISGATDSFFLATQAGVYHISELLPCGEYQESAPVSVVFDSILTDVRMLKLVVFIHGMILLIRKVEHIRS